MHQKIRKQSTWFGDIGNGNLGDGSRPKLHASSELCTGYRKCGGGSAVKKGLVPRGLETQSNPVQVGGQEVGSTHHRRFRDEGKQAVEPVRQLGTKPQLYLGKFDGSQVERGERLGKPPVLNVEQDFDEDQGGEEHGLPPRTSLASTTLVHNAAGIGGGSADDSAERPSSVLEADGTSDAKHSDPEVGYSRLEIIRRALSAKGLSNTVIEQLFKKWEPSTHESYEQAWSLWQKFADEHGGSSTAPDSNLLTSWISSLIEKGSAQGTVQKYWYIIQQVLRMVGTDSAYKEIDKFLIDSAGKINKPKGAKYTEIWDVSYGIEFNMKRLVKSDSILNAVVALIVVLKCLSGWRSADLTGISVEDGVRKVEGGYQLRFYDGKVSKKKWSRWTFFPRLSKAYRKTCVVYRLEALLKLTRVFPIKKKLFGGALQTPLFLSGKPNSAGELYAIKENTIANKAKGEFLANFLVENDTPLSKFYGAHSFRHANASALFDSGVAPNVIAAHQQTSAESAVETYIMQVRRDWKIPKHCVANLDSLVEVLLAPYVHWKTTQGEENTPCGCRKMLHSGSE